MASTQQESVLVDHGFTCTGFTAAAVDRQPQGDTSSNAKCGRRNSSASIFVLALCPSGAFLKMGANLRGWPGHRIARARRPHRRACYGILLMDRLTAHSPCSRPTHAHAHLRSAEPAAAGTPSTPVWPAISAGVRSCTGRAARVCRRLCRWGWSRPWKRHHRISASGGRRSKR